ncbi:hypothetical protein PQR64_31815 [Paraburkholderia phytofirmans]|uniref:hypothetical protein n=1 Tax=Paraburkholderia phytofirmans TaxID=261302 RepID=UPI0038BB0B4B
MDAALLDEAAAASTSLEDQGRQLIEAAAFFPLDGTSASPPVWSLPEPIRRRSSRRVSATNTAAPAPVATGITDYCHAF